MSRKYRRGSNGGLTHEQTIKAQQEDIAARRAALIVGPDGRPYHPNPRSGHGTNESYSHDGCRCVTCTSGASEYRRDLHERKRNQRLKRADPNIVIDPATVFKF